MRGSLTKVLQSATVSWHWYAWPIGVLNYQYLTQAYRRKMNELADMVNTEIVNAVARAGDRFRLSNGTRLVGGDLNGRFRMPGVQEPDPNRSDLLSFT